MTRDEVLSLPSFTPIFNSLIDEQVAEGLMPPADLGVYVVLQRRSNWETGVVITNASALVTAFGGSAAFGNVQAEASIRKSLDRLRANGFINYSPVKGSRSTYRIVINKYLVRSGKKRGQRLNAFESRDLASSEHVQKASQAHDKCMTGSGEDYDKELTGAGDRHDECETGAGQAHYTRNIDKELREEEGRGKEGRSAHLSFPDPDLADSCMGEPEPAAPANHSALNLIPGSLLEPTMPNSPWEGAVRLCRLLFAASRRSPSDETLTTAAESLLPLMEQNPDWSAHWPFVSDRVFYVISASKLYPMEGKEGPFTWFDAITSANDPVGSFIRNYEKISAATERYLEEREKKRKQQQFIEEFGGVPEHANAAIDAVFAAAVK